MGSRDGIEALLFLLDEAFRGRGIEESNASHHDSGEIDHIRSLLDGDDRWRFVQLGFG